MKKPLILHGGVDINPSLYGYLPHPETQYPSDHRDFIEFQQTDKAINEGTPIVGICRGAQLLCIRNGGTLWQHSQPSEQNHPIACKDLDGIPNEFSLINNVIASHHQIMKPVGHYVLYAWNPEEVIVWHSRRVGEESYEAVESMYEVLENTPEVVWWPETKSLGIQPHPEWATENDPFKLWVNELMKSLEIDYVF